MSPRRLRALVRRVVAEVRRDRPSLALLFIAPIIITGLLTYILREGNTPHVRSRSSTRVLRRPASWSRRPRRGRDHGDRRCRRGRGAGRRRGPHGDPRHRHPGRPRSRRRPPGDHARPGSARRQLGARRGGQRRHAHARHCRRVARPDHRPGDDLRHRQRRPDGAVRARDRGLLPVLLRLPPDGRQLPPRADRRDARAPDGDAGHAGRGRRRIPPGLRAVRHGPGGDPARVGAGDGPRAVDRAAARVLAGPRDPGRRQPGDRLPRRRAARARGDQPRDLPLDVRAYRAPGHPVHPRRAGAAVPAVGRAVPHRQPAGDPPAVGRADAAALRRRGAPARVHPGRRPVEHGARRRRRRPRR